MLGQTEYYEPEPGPMCSTLESILCKFGCMRNLSNVVQGQIEGRIMADPNSPPLKQNKGVRSDASIPSQVYLYSHSDTKDDISAEDFRLKTHKIVGTMSSKELTNYTGITVDTTKMSSPPTSNDDGDANVDEEDDESVIYQHQVRFGFGFGDKDSGSTNCNLMSSLDQSVSSISCPSFSDSAALYTMDNHNPQDLLLVGTDSGDKGDGINLVSQSSNKHQDLEDDSLLSFDALSHTSRNSDPLHNLLSFDSSPDRRDDTYSSKSSSSQLRVSDICDESMDESHHSISGSSQDSKVTSREDSTLRL